MESKDYTQSQAQVLSVQYKPQYLDSTPPSAKDYKYIIATLS